MTGIIISPSSKLQPGGGMHKICKVHNEKCFDTNTCVNLALLQMRFMPVGQGLPHPATFLVKRPFRGLMPRLTKH